MPSQSFVDFSFNIERSNVLYSKEIIESKRSMHERQPFYGSAIVSACGYWESYVKSIVIEANNALRSANNQQLSQLSVISGSQISRIISKINTVNFDTGRDVINLCVGFDPIQIWAYPKKSWPWQAVQDRLNELLKVRHAFAHGASLPRFQWTIDSRGNASLKKSVVTENIDLLKYLAKQSDLAISNHISSSYSMSSPW